MSTAPAAEVFDRPVLYYENRRRRFRITDAAGRVVARTTPVHGGEGTNGFMLAVGEGNPSPHLALRFSGPDDEPILFIERGQDEPGLVVKDAHGEQLGRLGSPPANGNGLEAARVEGLVGGDGTPFMTVAWKAQHGYESAKGYCELILADGRRAGRYDRRVLRLDYGFAWPLQALPVVAPILSYLRSGG